MSQSQTKKLKQMHRREIRRAAQNQASQMLSMIKPKPKYIPDWLWGKLVRLVINF